MYAAAASTVRLRPVRIPVRSPEAIQANKVRHWFAFTAFTGEARARRLLLAIEPTSGKIQRRSREGLRAAIAILGTDPVDIRDLRAVLRDLSRSGCLCNVRAGRLDDASLWDDAQNALGIARAAAERRGAASVAVELLGRCLSVVDALLSVPEGERAAVVGREIA